VAVSVTGLVLLLVTAAALAFTGALSQPAGSAGCISETGAGPCADGHGLSGADTVAVSPNGKTVYVVSGDAVVRLNRSTTTGALTQPAASAGCISETGAGPCADGHGLKGGFGLAISLDGKSVYSVSQGSDAVTRFKRNTSTGALTQPAGSAGCISETGAGPCADGHGLTAADSVTVSRDGQNVYVTSHNGIVRLNRNTTTGAISEPAGNAGCISDTGAGPCAAGHALKGGADSVAVSRDGKSVYVASYPNSAVLRLKRDPGTGAITQPAGSAGCISDTGAGSCAAGHALAGAVSVIVSANGKNVYVASNTDNAVVRLKRDTTTGAITEAAGSAACISETGAGQCADGHALKGPVWVVLSRDDKSIYAAAHLSNAVVRLRRSTTTGAISEPAGHAGCTSEAGAGSCADGHALVTDLSVDVSPDGMSVYAASLGSNAVARFNLSP
jgi:sugar lactone lactonase YvrE